MKKRLYKTIIQIEVLSEDPYDFIGLDMTHEDITDGDCSGITKVISQNKIIEGKEAASEVHKHGTDPSFFNMDKEGNISVDSW